MNPALLLLGFFDDCFNGFESLLCCIGCWKVCGVNFGHVIFLHLLSNIWFPIFQLLWSFEGCLFGYDVAVKADSLCSSVFYPIFLGSLVWLLGRLPRVWMPSHWTLRRWTLWWGALRRSLWVLLLEGFNFRRFFPLHFLRILDILVIGPAIFGFPNQPITALDWFLRCDSARIRSLKRGRGSSSTARARGRAKTTTSSTESTTRRWSIMMIAPEATTPK